MLITSRIGSWSAGVERLDLHVLAPADAVAFLMERAANRRQAPDDAAQAAAIARELDGLALALEQAGAYVEEESLSFAEYLQHWRARRQEVLAWHDERLMQYPRSVAITWETTFAQLPEPARRLLGVLAWLAPEPIPLLLFDAAPLVEAIPEPRKALASLQALLAGAVRRDGRGRSWCTGWCRRSPAAAAPRPTATTPYESPWRPWMPSPRGDAEDVRTWDVWTPLAAHAEAVARFADAAGLPEPTARLMNELGLYWKARGQFGAAEPLFRRALAIGEASYGPDHPDVAIRPQQPGGAAARPPTAWPRPSRSTAAPWRSTRRATARTTPTSPPTSTTWRCCSRTPTAWPRPSRSTAARWRSTRRATARTTPTSPETSTTWRSCCGPPTAWPRPSPSTAAACRSWIDFQRRTGHQHPNFRVGRENYVGFLESTGKTPEQIEQHLDELVRSPRSDGS